MSWKFSLTFILKCFFLKFSVEISEKKFAIRVVFINKSFQNWPLSEQIIFTFLRKTMGRVKLYSLVQKVSEKSPTVVKNFGIWVRYDSRSGTHNMYREYRDTQTAGAVTQCYRDMGARHRARPGSIQILKVSRKN